MFALLFGLMYLMFIRPNSKRRREADQMQKALGPGDKIVTIGGMFGTVTQMDDEGVTLEVSPGVNVKYARQAIARVVESVNPPAETDHSTDESASPIQESKKTS